MCINKVVQFNKPVTNILYSLSLNVQQPFTIYPLGDCAVTFQLGNTIQQSSHQQLLNMQQWLQSKQFNFIRNIIPAYNSITIIYDVYKVKLLSENNTAYSFVNNLLQTAYKQAEAVNTKTVTVRIPVCYHTDYALDIGEVAKHNNISINKVIELHCSTAWRVYMIGFLPGFPYMGMLPKKLSTPRKKTPRLLVEAGSVAIAGNQTGIYSMASPGGWNIIGKTPVSLFDVNSKNPCLLQSGDMVNFYPIEKEEMNMMYEVRC